MMPIELPFFRATKGWHMAAPVRETFLAFGVEFLPIWDAGRVSSANCVKCWRQRAIDTLGKILSSVVCSHGSEPAVGKIINCETVGEPDFGHCWTSHLIWAQTVFWNILTNIPIAGRGSSEKPKKPKIRERGTELSRQHVAGRVDCCP